MYCVFSSMSVFLVFYYVKDKQLFVSSPHIFMQPLVHHNWQAFSSSTRNNVLLKVGIITLGDRIGNIHSLGYDHHVHRHMPPPSCKFLNHFQPSFQEEELSDLRLKVDSLSKVSKSVINCCESHWNFILLQTGLPLFRPMWASSVQCRHWSRHMVKASFIPHAWVTNTHKSKCSHLATPECSKTPASRWMSLHQG